jgi:hypothetical protein
MRTRVEPVRLADLREVEARTRERGRVLVSMSGCEGKRLRRG